jgi:hypothetical protein
MSAEPREIGRRRAQKQRPRLVQPGAIWLYRSCPRVIRTITIVRPETVLRWHRWTYATRAGKFST